MQTHKIRRPVFVTGIGVTSPVCNSVEELWRKASLGQPSNPIAGCLRLAGVNPFELPLSPMEQAMTQAGWQNLDSTNDAFFFATTTGQISLFENDLIRFSKKEI